VEDPWAKEGVDYPSERRGRSKLTLLLGAALVAVLAAGALWIVPPFIHGLLNPNSAPSRPIMAVAISADRPDFVSDDLGFAVKFPGEPVRHDSTGPGEDQVLTTFKSGADEAGYLVSVMDLHCSPSASDVDPWLNESAAAAVKSMFPDDGSPGALVNPKFTTVASHRAVQAEVTQGVGGQKKDLKVAVLFAGSRYFSLVAANPPYGSWDTFVQSLRVTADDGALPDCAPLATT
jgi:hypothetical protein